MVSMTISLRTAKVGSGDSVSEFTRLCGGGTVTVRGLVCAGVITTGSLSRTCSNLHPLPLVVFLFFPGELELELELLAACSSARNQVFLITITPNTTLLINYYTIYTAS